MIQAAQNGGAADTVNSGKVFTMDIFGGIFGLLILILNIYAIIKIVSSGASVAAKIIWVIVILLLPLLGLIIWFLAGPK